MPDYDVLIVGAGPVGSALALALRGVCSVAVLEARTEGSIPSDPRPIALSHGSRLILERLGVWDELRPATPIKRIHISQRGAFGQVQLDSEEAGLPALGYVIDYIELARALSRLVAGAGHYVGGASALTIAAGQNEVSVEYRSGMKPAHCSARLVAIADGGAAATVAEVRARNYPQAAVTAQISSSRPHLNVAYERFTADGPLALLPAGERLSMVWSTRPSYAKELCAMADGDFLKHLQNAFGQRLGTFMMTGPRTLFPLALKVFGAPRISRAVVLGNAAQTLHPVAGQGLNLGLRDAWELAECIVSAARDEIGEPAMLAAYSGRRRLDRRGGIWFTDSLVRLFSNDLGPLKLARGLGLSLLGAVPSAKAFIVRRMTFGARG